MRVAERAIDIVSRGLAFIAGLCVLLMMVHVMADVTFKYLMNMPLQGTLEVVSQYYMVAVVFLPLAIVEMRRQHVTVDVFVSLMARSASRRLYVITSLLAGVFYGVLTYQSYLTAVHSTEIQEVMMGISYIVIWPSKWLLPVSFGAVTIAVVLHALQAMRGEESGSDTAALAE